MNKARTVVTGLEGSGKSTKVFARISEVTTVDKPVLIAVKNYALMKLQIQSWLERKELAYLNLKESDFAIAGCNKVYPQALEAYSNPSNPKLIGKEVKFVFTTQAQLQRQGHLRFIREGSLQRLQYSHILVDEFSATSGYIPYGLDCALNGDPAMTPAEKIRWVGKNYTIYDKEAAEQALYAGKTGYFLAYWIESTTCPITFLTSEKLAAELLKAIGFEEETIESPDYSNCTVNIWSHQNITKDFLIEMNTLELKMWRKVAQNYNVIISDQVGKWINESQEEDLEVRVYNHMSVRGRNDLMGTNILTILTHIPTSYIIGLQKVLNQFANEKNYTYEEVERLFYRDRVMQDIGRVLGHRGSTTTDVILHKSLVKALQTAELPYTLNLNWKFELEGLELVLEKVNNAKNEKREIREGRKVSKVPITDYAFLESYFENTPGSYTTSKKVKEVTKKILEKHTNKLASMGIFSPVPSSKVALYFGLPKPKNKRIEGKTVQVVEGLKIKNV